MNNCFLVVVAMIEALFPFPVDSYQIMAILLLSVL
jgi:hypothetical protein